MTILISLLLASGLLVFFLGVALSPGDVGTYLTYAGAALVVGALGWRISHFTQAQSEAAKRVEGWIVASYVGVAASLGLKLFASSFAGDGADSESLLPGIVAVSWPALLLISGLPLAFTEAVYGFMPVEDSVDERRVRSAAFGGLTIAFALVFVVSLNFVAWNKDVREDLSYFRVSAPSDGTLQAVDALDQPVRVVLMFPTNNDVLNRLRPYFDEVDRASQQLTVEVRDHALSPQLAEDHNISDNGNIVILQGEEDDEAADVEMPDDDAHANLRRRVRAETINVGLDLVGARSTLRTLDGQFRRAFAKLTTVPRELYLTAGHRERTPTGAGGDPRPEWISVFADILRQNNITSRNLGVRQGLAEAVPEDAPAVAVVGPREPFLEEEARALLNYVMDGGRLMVFVDPDVDHGLDPLFRGLGLELQQGVVASERDFIPRTRTPADRTFIHTARFSGHPTVTDAMRATSQGYSSFFFGSGALDAYNGEEKREGTRQIFPITTTGQFWLDADGDFEKGSEERSGQFKLMAAVTVPREEGREGRAVVVADGDFIADGLIQRNFPVLGNTVDWLVGQEQIVGEVSSEEDVTIDLTADEDKMYFWGLSFVVPLPVALLGGFVGFRRRRRRRGGDKEAPKAATDAKRAGKADPDPAGELDAEKSDDSTDADASDVEASDAESEGSGEEESEESDEEESK